jgi:hypothetical protein
MKKINASTLAIIVDSSDGVDASHLATSEVRLIPNDRRALIVVKPVFRFVFFPMSSENPSIANCHDMTSGSFQLCGVLYD